MISHPHKTIFIHIPKCGGQSIETCFLSDLGLSWKNRQPLLLHRNNNLEIGPPRLGHMTCEEYIKYHYASQEMFLDYYSFSILRDPVSRVISIYNYLQPKQFFYSKIDFNSFLFKWLPFHLNSVLDSQSNHPKRLDSKILNGNLYWFIKPQSSYILNSEGAMLVKDVFMLEDINRAFPLIKQKSNLSSELVHVNKSKKTFTSNDLNVEQNQFIRNLYKEDFILIDRILKGASYSI